MWLAERLFNFKLVVVYLKIVVLKAARLNTASLIIDLIVPCKPGNFSSYPTLTVIILLDKNFNFENVSTLSTVLIPTHFTHVKTNIPL